MTSKILKLFLTVLPVLALGFAIASKAEARTINVNCNAKSLQTALNRSNRGDVFNVSGTCFERITINTDNVTINGGGSAIIDGTFLSSGTLLRVQAHTAKILNITVQNGPRSGIHVRRSGSATIQGTTVTDNGSNGILVNQSSYAFIGGDSNHHALAGNPGSQGNTITGNTGHGINLRGSANADIFHNLITGNIQRGIQISNAASADIDGNVITGNVRGISLSSNGSAALSTDTGHHDTGAGDARPVIDPENNLIEGNGIGFNCSVGGSATGNPQNFGTLLGGGNPGGGDHTDDTIVATSCAIANSLNIP